MFDLTTCDSLKHFFTEVESILLAFGSQNLGQILIATVEHCDFTLMFILELLEDPVPVGPSSISSGFQSCNGILAHVLKKNQWR